ALNKRDRIDPLEKQDSWKDFIYNPRTGEFLGRTAGSWASFSLTHPEYFLRLWVGLGLVASHCQNYNAGRTFCQSRMVSQNTGSLKRYIQASFCLSSSSGYNDSIQERNDLCMVGEYTTQDNEPIKKVCQFKRSTLRQCSGLPDPSFGFKEGKPCIIIKLNRVIGLKPEGDPYINCTAKRATSLQMQYFPSEGRLDKMFFPYYGKKSHPDYVQPLVAVKLLFTKEDYNIEQTVECKVEGSNLRNDDERDKFLGRVTFRVKVSE
uniref:Sodium/potassium-transporting ATPase subunit beta-3 n=1 Tax=Pundamilia nyererei TaxID=303518 RepID=A0A3B4HAP3_9CICH